MISIVLLPLSYLSLLEEHHGAIAQDGRPKVHPCSRRVASATPRQRARVQLQRDTGRHRADTKRVLDNQALELSSRREAPYGKETSGRSNAV